jgi:MATE family multidrug resistance protein
MTMDAGERVPLLAGTATSSKPDETTFKHEARVLATYIIPASAMNFCRYLVMGASLFSIAHLGTRELAAANLGLLTCNIGGYAIVIGLCA